MDEVYRAPAGSEGEGQSIQPFKVICGIILMVIGAIAITFTVLGLIAEVLLLSGLEAVDVLVRLVPLMIKLTILALVSFGLYQLGERYLMHERYDMVSMEERHLRKIYEAEGLALIDYEPVSESTYQDCSPSELRDVYSHIDGELYPEKFEDLLAMIKMRFERVNSKANQSTVI